MPAVTEEQVLDALRKVQDPELHRDVVSLGMIEGLRVEGGTVSLTLNLTTPACPLRAEMEAQVRAAAQGELSTTSAGAVACRLVAHW